MFLRLQVVVLCLLKGPRVTTGQNPMWKWGTPGGSKGHREKGVCNGGVKATATCVCSSARGRPEHTAEARMGYSIQPQQAEMSGGAVSLAFPCRL